MRCSRIAAIGGIACWPIICQFSTRNGSTLWHSQGVRIPIACAWASAMAARLSVGRNETDLESREPVGWALKIFNRVVALPLRRPAGRGRAFRLGGGKTRQRRGLAAWRTRPRYEAGRLSRQSWYAAATAMQSPPHRSTKCGEHRIARRATFWKLFLTWKQFLAYLRCLPREALVMAWREWAYAPTEVTVKRSRPPA